MTTTFAWRLKNAMEQAGLNQADLSRRAGASRAAISQYLSGKNIPGLERIAALADATGFQHRGGYFFYSFGSGISSNSRCIS